MMKERKGHLCADEGLDGGGAHASQYLTLLEGHGRLILSSVGWSLSHSEVSFQALLYAEGRLTVDKGFHGFSHF